MLHTVAEDVLPDLPILVMVTAGILLTGSAMLAQAMESVTRIFYARSDLELILSAPVRPGKLFAVRLAAMALSAACMSMLVVGPFINVLAWRGGISGLGLWGPDRPFDHDHSARGGADDLLFKTPARRARDSPHK